MNIRPRPRIIDAGYATEEEEHWEIFPCLISCVA